ncbi:hypothetical protein BpHYR1_049644 [Brachionus plicatilis]|uniref:Uncharacterized protein n=1 Tax=Brachionus plicatilis TaxID=10195 RepID=A0A3M7R5V2_BRAPC|nr:hypothetical protein BpHYR1_049644 [Brachionus plicatilis]
MNFNFFGSSYPLPKSDLLLPKSLKKFKFRLSMAVETQFWSKVYACATSRVSAVYFLKIAELVIVYRSVKFGLGYQIFGGHKAQIIRVRSGFGIGFADFRTFCCSSLTVLIGISSSKKSLLVCSLNLAVSGKSSVFL